MSLRPFTPIDPEDPRGAVRVVRVNLANVDSAGGVAAIANPFGEAAVVTEAILNVATAASAACTLDIGVAADATTSNDTLIDGKDVNGGTGISHSMLEHVAATGNAAGVKAIGATQYVTASVKTGASAGLVGTLQCTFVKVAAVA